MEIIIFSVRLSSMNFVAALAYTVHVVGASCKYISS